MSWASLATDLLWPNALVVVPLAALVAVVCRCVPCRPTTRHSLWLVVLLWFVVPPLLPELHASATGRRDSPALAVAPPRPASVVQFPNNLRTRGSARPIFDEQAGAARPPFELPATWPRYARTPPPAATKFGTVIGSPKRSEILPRLRRVTGAVETVAPAPTEAQWGVLPSIFAVRDAVGRLPSIPPGLWLLGVAVVVLLRFVQVAAFRRMMRDTRPASGDVIDAVAAASGQIGLRRVPVTLMMGDSRDGQGGLSPFVWCGWSTRLILPAGLWSRLDEPGRRSVILHELAHIARRDQWVCRLTWAVCCVYWWHPVAWWVRRRLREEADFCCDGWVTWLEPRGRRAYAEALLTTKQYISLPHFPIPEFAISALTGGAKGFAARIRFIMTQTVGPNVSFRGMGMIVILSLVGWAATPVRSSVPETKRAPIPESDVVVPVVYALAPPGAPALPDHSWHGFADGVRLPDDSHVLEARLLVLEQRIESLSANVALLTATRLTRGRARLRGVAASEPVSCPECNAREDSIARVSDSLRRRIGEIGIVANGIDTKAAVLRAQSHEFRLAAEKMARHARKRRPKTGSENLKGAINALRVAAEAHALKIRGDAADAQATLLRFQVRVLERCAVQLKSEADTLDREQSGLGERLSPLRDWVSANEARSGRRRM